MRGPPSSRAQAAAGAASTLTVRQHMRVLRRELVPVLAVGRQMAPCMLGMGQRFKVGHCDAGRHFAGVVHLHSLWHRAVLLLPPPAVRWHARATGLRHKPSIATVRFGAGPKRAAVGLHRHKPHEALHRWCARLGDQHSLGITVPLPSLVAARAPASRVSCSGASLDRAWRLRVGLAGVDTLRHINLPDRLVCPRPSHRCGGVFVPEPSRRDEV